MDDFGTIARVRVGPPMDGRRLAGRFGVGCGGGILCRLFRYAQKQRLSRGEWRRKAVVMEVVSKGGHHDGSGEGRKKLLYGEKRVKKKKKGIAYIRLLYTFSFFFAYANAPALCIIQLTVLGSIHYTQQCVCVCVCAISGNGHSL